MSNPVDEQQTLTLPEVLSVLQATLAPSPVIEDDDSEKLSPEEIKMMGARLGYGG